MISSNLFTGYVLAVSALACFALCMHVLNNNIIKRQSRNAFAVTALLNFLRIVLELSYTQFRYFKAAPGLCLTLITVEEILVPLGVASVLYALSMKKAFKAVLIYTAFFSVVAFAIQFSGQGYTIDADYNFNHGPLMWISYINGIVGDMSLPVLLVLMSFRYKKKDIRSIIMTILIFLFGYIADIAFYMDMLNYLTTSIALLLMYSYYEDFEQQLLMDDLIQKDALLRESNIQTVQVLAGSIDAKDAYTRGHSQRVSEYAVLLARKLGWDEDSLEKLRLEGLMHDTGKVGIPDSVLNKRGRLSDIEFWMIKAHTLLGADILKQITTIPEVYTAARYHHERFDGRGYPDRLAGKDIPIEARILCIVDSYDAMNSDRIYRKALSKEIIREELVKGSGTQFDPELLEVFLQMFDNGELDEIGSTGRRDISFTGIKSHMLIQSEDILDAIKMHAEFLENWNSKYDRIEQLHQYLVKNAEACESRCGLAVIDVENAAASEEQIEDAINILRKSLDAIDESYTVSRLISSTQLAVVTDESDPGREPIDSFIKRALLAYYKTFDTAGWSISYKIY